MRSQWVLPRFPRFSSRFTSFSKVNSNEMPRVLGFARCGERKGKQTAAAASEKKTKKLGNEFSSASASTR